jgi:hypothetical protein
MSPNDIRSIGWLHNADGTITLTPVFNGNNHPVKVILSFLEFEPIRNDLQKMKEKAIEKLSVIVPSIAC